MIRIFIIALVLISSLKADVKSTTGQIKFDTQMDNLAEMTLNGTGLGIGITPSENLHVNGNAIITNQVFIGGSSGSSNLNVNGTLGYGFQMVSSNTTLGESSVILVDSSSDNITISLPYAGNVTGRNYQIKKISTSNSVWVSGGGNLIDDTDPIELPESNNLASVKLISNGSQWYKFDQKDTSETIAADNLVGWWKLDSSSTNIALDSSTFSNDGELTSTGSFSGCSITGFIQKGLSLDGVDDYINIPDSSDYEVNHFTYMAWIYSTVAGASTANQTVMSKGDAPFSIYLSVGGQVVSLYHEGPANWLNGTATVPLNQWVHVAGSWDGTTRKIYLNGSLDASVADSTNTSYDTTPLRIGRRSDGASTTFSGNIDDVRIYSRALTDAEIQAIYNIQSQ